MLTLMEHQGAIRARSRSQSSLLVVADPGTGKTIATLSILEDRPMPTLVVAPPSVMRAAWLADSRHFRESLRLRIHHGPNRWRRRGAILSAVSSQPPEDRDVLVVVTTFDIFRRDWKRIREVFPFRRLVIDESSKIKGLPWRVKVSEVAHACADLCDEVILLTGTPATQGPQDYWSQLRAIDSSPGGLADNPHMSSGSPSFHRWSGYWLTAIEREVPVKKRNPRTGRTEVSMKKKPIAWHVRRGRDQEFAAMLAKAMIRIRIDDVLDLPESHEIIVPVELGRGEVETYTSVLDGLDVEIGGEAFEVESSVAAMKLRQITGGNVKVDGEWHEVGTAKLDALRDLVDSLGDEPYPVWTQFRREADRAAELLVAAGRRVGRCDGSVSQAEKDAAIRGFVEGELDTLVCHPMSVAHGITLTKCGDRPCRYSIEFSHGGPPENFIQQRARIRRAGQTERCIYYVLQAPGTVDETALRALHRRENASEAVLRAVQLHSPSIRGEGVLGGAS